MSDKKNSKDVEQFLDDIVTLGEKYIHEANAKNYVSAAAYMSLVDACAGLVLRIAELEKRVNALTCKSLDIGKNP